MICPSYFVRDMVYFKSCKNYLKVGKTSNITDSESNNTPYKQVENSFLETETSIYELDSKSFENLNGETNNLDTKNYTYSPNDKKVYFKY